MNKKKIAFVVVRYGKEVNGGGEVHCRMLAERLQQIYDVEVLTTCLQEFGKPEKNYPEGTEQLGAITVRRFKTIPYNTQLFRTRRKHSKLARKIRFQLFKWGILKFIANRHPLWKLSLQAEREFQESYESHSTELLDYITTHQQDYDAFIFMTYYFPHTQVGGLIAPKKSILIPTAHREKELFFSVYTHLFTQIGQIAFNTRAEQLLCEEAFGKSLSQNEVVGVGVEFQPSAPWEEVKSKYQLPDEYVLYLGRVTGGKINSLIEDYIAYYQQASQKVKLILTGGIDKGFPVKEHEALQFTGFVSEAEKSAIVEHATVMINPSRKESLSLLLLEGLSKGIPVLVDGHCDVLKDHCTLSQGAALPYHSKKELFRLLDRLLSTPTLRIEMGAKGKEYVRTHYDWEIIMKKFTQLIENV